MTSRSSYGTNHAGLDFIWTDLGVILTFATTAETAYRMGHREHAEPTLPLSEEKGYSDMLRYFSKATVQAPGIDQDELA